MVIPTIDRADSLQEAIDSILGQDYAGDIEVVVVYDGVDPGEVRPTAERGRAGRVVRQMSTPQRVGAGPARNFGAAHVESELLAFCDDDDTWRTDKLTRQVAQLQADHAGVCLSGILVRSGEHEIERVPLRSDLTLATVVRTRLAAAHLSTTLVRTEEWRTTIGEFDVDVPGSFGEDYDWLIRALRVTRCTTVEAPLVDVRWHEGSFFARKWDVMDRALTYLVAKHPEISADRRALARIRGQQAVARAGQGHRAAARGTAWRAWRLDPRERRAYVAMAAAVGIVDLDRIVNLANRFGRGI